MKGPPAGKDRSPPRSRNELGGQPTWRLCILLPTDGCTEHIDERYARALLQQDAICSMDRLRTQCCVTCKGAEDSKVSEGLSQSLYYRLPREA